jgi:hypothetical protein
MHDDAELFERAVTLYKQIGDRYSTARAQFYFGMSRKQAGDVACARELLLAARAGFATILPQVLEMIDGELAGLE